MQIPNPKIESRILGYLFSRPHGVMQFVSPRKVIEICLPSLLDEQQVRDPDELRHLLYNMEYRGLLERKRNDDFVIADKGYLQFKLSLAIFENAKENKKLFEKIIDSSIVSNEIKKDIKNFVNSSIGKTGEEIIKNVIRLIAKNPEYLHEILRLIEEVEITTGN